MTNPIAERTLLFSEKGETERKRLVIRVFAPRPIQAGSVAFQPDDKMSGCVVEFDGLPNFSLGEIYGADSLQALQLAVDIEPYLKRLSEKYDFFFPTGEGYFEG
jgi:hypothetical protein